MQPRTSHLNTQSTLQQHHCTHQPLPLLQLHAVVTTPCYNAYHTQACSQDASQRRTFHTFAHRMVGYTPASSAARCGSQGCSHAWIGCVSRVGSHDSTAAAMRGSTSPVSSWRSAPRGSSGCQASSQASSGSGQRGSHVVMAELRRQQQQELGVDHARCQPWPVNPSCSCFFGTDRMACMAGTSSCATSTAHTGFWHLLLVQTIMCTSCSLKS